MKKVNCTSRFLLFALLVNGAFIASSCANKRMQVNPGAYVTVDGTDDGLKNIQRDFKDASRTDEGIKVTLSSDVLFGINSSFLSASAKKELDKFYQSTRELSNLKLLIEGHTDATGAKDYNVTLSEKRALSVRDYLISKGLQKDRFVVKGHGPSKPIAPNNTAVGRSKNRRVEITILN
jgi:outer membrane protein OmpA-like peptidoglycan-associated protein